MLLYEAMRERAAVQRRLAEVRRTRSSTEQGADPRAEVQALQERLRELNATIDRHRSREAAGRPTDSHGQGRASPSMGAGMGPGRRHRPGR